MSQAEHSDRELLALIGGACDVTLTSIEATRLESLLRDSAAAQQCFQSYMLLDAELHWREIGPSKAFRRSVELLGDIATSRSAVQLEPDEDVRGPFVVPVVQQRFWGFSTRALKLSAAAVVALAFWLVLGVWMLQERRPDRTLAESKPSTQGPTKADGPIASLVAEHDCRWRSIDAPIPHVGATFGTAKMLELESGHANLEFADGARVTLEGPSQFLLRSSGSGWLERGRLVAQVPPQAVGFTVETPTSQIVDLGTEFAVETDEHGTTEVQVLKGKVELRPGENGGGASRVVQTLVAGTARRIERSGSDGSVIVREIAPTPDRFTRPSLSVASSEVQQIKVEGAYASSTYQPYADVRFLIGGHGLTGNRHSAGYQSAMWHSDLGRVKNEFVLFDLARPYQLDSMKVWNWNGRELLWMGVKQADIYVSTSGKGDPLTKTAEWKLVVNDQKFAPGTGEEDYSTPTVIPLGNVEARFVAIVIDTVLGSDPRGTPQPDCVGLSEVQFFGSRVELPRPQTKQK